MLRFRTTTAAASLLTLLLATGGAAAFERQWHVGGAVGAGFFADEDTDAGPLLGLHGAYGLSDMFDVRAELNGAQHRRDDGTVRLLSVSAGMSYKLDVIRWIPYFGVQVGYYHLGGAVLPGELREQELGLSVDLGLDYAVSRAVAVGAQLRYHGFMHEPMSSLADAPYFGALLRCEYRWGW